MLGSEVIVDAIVRHGLQRIFIFPGGTVAPVLDVAEKRKIDIYCARHEQGAGYAALAAARLGGKPQVVMVTSGPGVTNLVTPVADAYFDSVPLVALTGQVGTGDMLGDLPIRQRGFQEVDTTALFRPITKAQFLPKTPGDLVEIMERAFAIAAEGRPGPVVVDLPMNVQRGEVGKIPSPAGDVRSKSASIPEPDPAKIGKAVEWLSAARRPVILAGGALTIPGFVIAAFAASPGLAVLAMAVVLGGFQVMVNNIQTLPSDFFSGKSVGTVAGVGGMSAVLGVLVFSTWLVPVLSRTSYVPVFLLGTALVPLALGAIHLLSGEIRRVDLDFPAGPR